MADWIVIGNELLEIKVVGWIALGNGLVKMVGWIAIGNEMAGGTAIGKGLADWIVVGNRPMVEVAG